MNALIAVPLCRNNSTHAAFTLAMAALIAFLVAMPRVVSAQGAAGPSAAITGRVTDASTHTAIIGASVTIEGTTIGTAQPVLELSGNQCLVVKVTD